MNKGRFLFPFSTRFQEPSYIQPLIGYFYVPQGIWMSHSILKLQVSKTDLTTKTNAHSTLLVSSLILVNVLPSTCLRKSRTWDGLPFPVSHALHYPSALLTCSVLSEFSLLRFLQDIPQPLPRQS